MINLGTAVGYLALDATNFNNTLDAAFTRVNNLDVQTNTLTGGLNVISSGLKTTGKVLTASVTTPTIAFGTSAVKAGAQFDSAMSKVMAIGGDFGEQQDDNAKALKQAAADAGLAYQEMGSYAETAFELVRQKAIQMGNDTKFTAEESASALYYMALAGWGGADMLEGLDGIMALSAASGVDLARTSDIVTDALTAFGEEANRAGRFADILAATSANSNTNVDLLGESFKYVAPVAGAYGYSLEDVSLALGTMASAGVKGTQAGTGLRQALKQLTTPTDENAALMEKFGISLYDANGKVIPLRDSMEQWRETFGGLNVELYDTEGNLKTGEQIMEEYGHALPINEQEKLNAVASIFGTRALPGILAIIGAADGDFKELAKDIDDSSISFNGMGDAAYQQEKMMDNLTGDWIYFTSALGTAKIIITDLVKQPLRDLLQNLRDLVTAFNNASPETQKFILKIAAIAAAVGPALFAMGAIVGSISKFINNIKNIHAAIELIGHGFSSLGHIIGGITSPIGIAIAAIVALVAIFIHLWNTNEDFRKHMTLIWNNIVATVSHSIGEIKKNFDKLMEVWGPAIEMLKQLAGEIIDAFAPLFEGVFAALGATITEIASLVSDVFGLIVSLISGDFSSAAEYAKSIWDNLRTFVVTVFDSLIWGVLQFIAGVAQAFGPMMETIFGAAQELLVTFGTFIWEKITSFFSMIGEGIMTALDFVVDGISDIYDGITGWFDDILTAAATWLFNFILDGTEAAVGFYDTVTDWVSKLPGKIYEFFSNIISDAIEWASNFIEEGNEAANNFYYDVTEKIENTKRDVAQYFSNIISDAIQWASDFAAKAEEAASDVYNNVVDGISELPGKVFSIGEDVVRGLWEGISSMGGWLWDKAVGFASDVVDALKAGAEVGSPSKLAAREVGRWLPPGIAVGFEKALPATMRGMANTLNDAITDYSKDINDFVLGATVVDPSIATNVGDVQSISSMYMILAQYIAEALRNAPIVNNVNVDMEDGDVYFDNERVGRKLAPVVSRVIAMGGG